MIGSLMASIGIGSATIDTILETGEIKAGAILRGNIVIRGGKVSQEIDALMLDLTSEVTEEIDDKELKVPHCWASIRVSDPLTIEPDETRRISFEMPVPVLSPLSVGRHHPKTWVATRADIEKAIDPRDRDGLRILPGDLHNAVFAAMESLGFRLTEAPLEPSRLNTSTGCLQEFEFKPTHECRLRHLEEVEMAFLPSTQGEMDLLIQRDTKARGLGSLLSEMAGTDESYAKLALLGNESVDAIQEVLEEALR
ncbi:sporulation protein [Modicisalibacter sp. MOD 31.J]|uniref:sporulation protein n=1 Tax=Modicisalibacter sp. MOD 31.J TaxID=2831897 RepID=UPI001CC92463|nr:sporulation protein [Modicisalibacter sp. MOD 31.J]MBZ9574504.1 sporulation protein [Modicisalibacter sp. MOD 31.J]